MKLLFTIQSIVLALAVMLSGAHAKDVMKLEALRHKPVIKQTLADDSAVRPMAEVHPHVDKQIVKAFYAGDVQQHVTHRSLRYLESGVKALSLEFRVGMSLWWQLLGMKLRS